MRIVCLIEKTRQGSLCTYGSPRVFQILKGTGETCSEDKDARIMQKYGIKAKAKRKFRRTTDSNHSGPVAENKLKQDFTASAPGEKWLGITYIDTGEGLLYFAFLLDVCTRKFVGWKLRPRMTRDLDLDALKMAAQSHKTADHAIKWTQEKILEMQGKVTTAR